MLAEIKLGAEIDFATKGELDDLGNSVVDRLSHRGKPRYLPPVVGSGSSSTSAVTPFQITLDGPPKGHMWDILGITTCGTDDHTVVAGNVALYVGNADNASLLDLRVPALVIPVYDSIGKDRLWAVQGSTIYAMVSGVANGQGVTVLVHVAEWRVQDVIETGLR